MLHARNRTMKSKHVIIRSTGCRTCRARKVKCDETRPSCQRCRRSGLLCQGYTEPTRFLSENPQGRGQSSADSHKSPIASFEALSLSAGPRAPTNPTRPNYGVQMTKSREGHQADSETRHHIIEERSGDGSMVSCKPPVLQSHLDKAMRVRAKKPKSRSACQTCKKRRVKCDEGEPQCLTCRKFGVECDGYETTLPVPFLPRTSSNLSMNILPATALFRNELEHQYFLHFQYEVVPGLSGPYPAAIWSYTILRACNEEPALRSLTISIAALSKAKYLYNTTASHQQFAIRQYGKALRGIQEIISTRSNASATRITLIASLLIFCFQNLLGEHEQAVAHIKCALNLLHNQFSTSKGRYSQLHSLSSLPELEDEVLEVFVRLDNTLKLRVDSSERNSGTSLLEIKYVDEEFHIPPNFHSIIDAKNYLDHCQYRAMSFFSHMPDLFMHATQVSYIPSEKIYEEVALQMHQWSKAFAPLLAQACAPSGNQDFIAAATLRVVALSTYLIVQRVCQVGNRVNPSGLFDVEAREIIDLTRRVVMDGRFKKTFVFDCGIIPSLFITILICRKRSFREEAIHVLRMAEGRMEIMWNAATVADMGESVLRAEFS